MADENDIVLKIAADTEAVKKSLADLSNNIKKNPPGEDAGDAFGHSFSLNMIAINQELELLKKAFEFGKAIVEFTKLGEEADAATKRFNIMAEQAGLIPENISSGIEKSTHGLVSLNDALASASQAVVTLGANASKIPEIFDIAVKTSKVFGGTATDNFEKLSYAIANGNQKSLRQLGIQVDVNNVTEDYARKLGLTTDFLSDAQKQQALLNAVLEKSKETYKSMPESLTPVADGMERLKVAAKDWAETMSSVIGKVATPVINQFTKNLTDEFNVWSNLIGRAKSESSSGSSGSIGPSTYENQKKTGDAVQQLTAEQQRKLVDLKLKANGDIIANEKIVSDEHINRMMENGLTEEEYQTALNERIRIAQEEHELKMQELQKNYMVLKTLDSDTYNQLMEETNAAYASNIKKIWKDLTDKVDANGKQIASIMKQAIVNSISQSIQFMVKNIMTGKNAFSGFVALVAGLMGDLAIQLGTTFIATGLAIDATKALAGGAAVAAGIGLIAVGAILKGLAGSGGGESGSTGGGGGYSAGFGSPDTQLTQQQDRVTPQTGVQVVVNGNIFDNKESALQIAQILNDSFDLSGTLVRANA